MSEKDQSQGARPSMDSPILSSDDDDLRRAPSARSLVRSIRKLDASKGLVVGIQGPWGFGKSSFINLMREGFAEKPEIVVVDFNPWMFSGSDQLVSLFFSQIGAELKLKGGNRFDAIAAGLDKYADALSPLANFIPIPGAGILAGLLRRILGGAVAKKRAAQSDIHGIRNSIVDTLKKLDQPIVVVIDDIDRLTTPEIREIFKLVRLTGNFPNVIYTLAFDRDRVEKALDEENVPGRAYLEKIIQLSFDVPEIA
ncbi:KAP family P-loop NTPase fold protein [Glaciihabitans sp. GrIS 2.15]|uniref:KAP family P-loop NTPase fold protein n=1 Tax=Glaciihabitans sp. GrIS 2.15 TaxID=3071710 RepID=UPI002E0748BF|nr:putative KAP-like P-loop ATPase [Glaciihabitans sp. GrIS 2.15]